MITQDAVSEYIGYQSENRFKYFKLKARIITNVRRRLLDVLMHSWCHNSPSVYLMRIKAAFDPNAGGGSVFNYRCSTAIIEKQEASV